MHCVSTDADKDMVVLSSSGITVMLALQIT